MRKRIVSLFFLLLLIAGCVVLFFQLRSNYESDRISTNTIDVIHHFPEQKELVLQNDVISVFDNPDVKAYLYFPDLDKGFPVLQSNDNSYYLRRNMYQHFDINGSIFLDYRCASDFSDQTSLIYGHNMDSGRMFGFLWKEYRRKDITGRQFQLYTRNGIFTYDILCTSIFPASGIHSYLLQDDALMSDLYESLALQQTGWNPNVNYYEDSSICTLMTCYGDGADYRFGVTGVLCSD